MQSTTIPTGRGRSLEGCLTCRQRHVKCDQRKPSCRRCDKSRLLCGGYQNSIVFGAEKSLEADTTRARRPLLTESERRRMSRLITSSIPPVLVWHQLNELDDDCETVAPDQDIAVSRGPFGVFRIHDSSRDTVPLHQNPIEIVDDEPASGFDFGADLATDDLQLSPATQAWFNSAFDQSNSESDGLFIRPGLLSSDMSRVVEVPDEVMPDYSDFMIPRREHSFSQFPLAFPTDINSFATVPSISHSLGANNPVPENAVFLLSHYSTTVISLLTPFRHNKTPWHILFIPHVKNCLAAIAMGESLDDASLCIFYATLALSAFSMSGISRSQNWMDEGKAHKSRAQYHAQIMLKAAYQVPKVAKYKSILMALITMVQVWLFSADQMRTEYFFLEAEKFIRLKGLSRLKSRKVRLLHHCYVFERLFYESTSVSAKISTQRARLQQDVQSSEVVAHGQDSPSFRVPIFVNLDEEMGRQKDQQEGENDLHLEKIGDFPATLYPEIFGVPETYMLLLSLIIRLGKARDGAEAGHAGGEPSISGYMAQAKAVERAILQMRQTDGTATNHSPVKQGENQVVMDNMLTAIQEALLIYLYRRIYDVDSTLLQSRVVAIRDCLLRCEAADEGSVCGSAGFIWPAFIAACEAEDVGVQGSFADLFNKVAQKSGLVKFSDMLLDVQEIWRERRKQSCTSFTWLDLMRRKVENG